MMIAEKRVLIVVVLACEVFFVLTERCWKFESPGFVSPSNDPFLEEGSTLLLNCTLKYVNLTQTPHDLIWTIKNANKSINSSSVKVISNTTAQLSIANASIEDSGLYSCKLNSSHASQLFDICSVSVQVGYPPPKDVKIRCEVQNWERMNCSWKQRYNPVKIDWQFKYVRNNRKWDCPKYFDSNQSCVLEDETLLAVPCFKIFLNGSNSLKQNVTTEWSFIIDQHVILNPPEVKLLNYTDKQAEIQWTLLSKDTLDVQCKIYHSCIRPDLEDCHEKMNLTKINAKKKLNCSVYANCRREGASWCSHSAPDKNSLSAPKNNIWARHLLKNLLPFTNYFIDVSCQITSTVFTEKWSKKQRITFRTEASAPSAVTSVILHSFEQIHSNFSGNLFLFWEDIPQHSKNGEWFYYKVSNGQETWKTNNSVILIKKLDISRIHNFTVTSCNEAGCSNFYNHVIIPKFNPNLLGPQIYAVQHFPKSSFYEVSWKTKKIDNKTMQVVILRCSIRNGDTLSDVNGKDFCHKPIFQFVDTQIGDNGFYSFNISSPPPSLGYKYKFAVALRNGNFSSVLPWTNCILVANNVPQPKIIPKIKEGTTWVEISWDAPNGCIIKDSIGFEIFYKNSVDNKALSKTVEDPFASSINLTGLLPSTQYEGWLRAKSLLFNHTPVTFTFQTKEGKGHETNSNNLTIVIGLFFAFFGFVLLSIAAVYLVRRIKSKVKELRNIQVPTGLREGSNLYYHPPLPPQLSDLVVGKYELPLITHITSSPPTSEKVLNGSHSSGFGSDFLESTTSSPTISSNWMHHPSGDSNIDPDTPSIIATDSVFDYPTIDPVLSYSQVGKCTTQNEFQMLDPSALDTRENDRSEENVPLSYAKVGFVPVSQSEDLVVEVFANDSTDRQSEQSNVGDVPLAKGYTTVAASDLMMQPYVKLALESSPVEPNVTPFERDSYKLSLPYGSSLTQNGEKLDFRDSAEQNGCVSSYTTLCPGYVSCNFLEEPVAEAREILYPKEEEDDDDDDELLSGDEENEISSKVFIELALKKTDDANG